MIKKKIAWLHPHFCYWTGGTKYIINVISELKKHYDITIYTEDYNTEVKIAIQNMGIRLVKIGPFSTNRLVYWGILPFLLPYELLKFRKDINSNDIIISSMFPTGVLANLINQKKHIQFVFEPFAFFHDKHMIEGYPLHIKLLMKTAGFIYGKLDLYMINKSRKLMTVNKDVSKWIQRIYGRRAEPSYLIIDPDKFKYRKDKFLENKYRGRKIVLHTTDYTPLKRTPFIINNFKKVVEKIPSALLLITTSRDLPESEITLQKYINKIGITKNVEIVGFVPNNDLTKYYSISNCAVYPGIGSGASACSYFVLEVMACKTPVVRTSDSIEEVVDGKSGFLFKPNDVSKMVDGILRLLRNEKLAKKMGENARNRILKIYTKKIVASNFISVINSVQ